LLISFALYFPLKLTDHFTCSLVPIHSFNIRQPRAVLIYFTRCDLMPDRQKNIAFFKYLFCEYRENPWGKENPWGRKTLGVKS
jgi:hypothetical protein